jgi:phage terminase large subunit-like protein
MAVRLSDPPRPAGVGGRAVYSHSRNRWEDGEYWFDIAAAQKAVDFFPKYIKFTEGRWAGQPFILEEWQARDIVRPLFGWKRADGTRRFRRCFVWIPRKNGKTELAAGIALLLLLGDAEYGAQVYSIASDKDQASIVFNKAVAMVSQSPELQADLDTWKTSIYCAPLNAAFKPLSGSPKGKHGLAMSGLVGDELHEWTNSDLYQFIHDSTGNRDQPLEFMISTAGKLGGVGEEFWRECEKIVDGVVDDPETLVVMYAASADDDWMDEKTWFRANPNLGVCKNLDTMRADAKRAALSPRKENAFKCYHLNLWTEQAVRWLPIDSVDDKGRRYGWNYCKGRFDWSELPALMRGKFCYTGIDLSSIQDLTALVHWFPVQGDLEKPVCIARFFKPADLLDEHIKRDLLPYDKWRDSGALIVTPGNVIDYEFVKKTLIRDYETFDIQNIGIDRHNATQFTVDMQNKGLPIEFFGQGFISMNPPSKELERLVISGGFWHGDNPILSRHARVVTVETDAAGNIKPTKQKSIERIDGIVALVEGIGISDSDDGRGRRLTSEKIEERGGLL